MRYKSGSSSQSGFYKTQKNTFTRNQFWPNYSITASDNKIMGLYAVWPNRTNYFTLIATGASITIDYGDGSTPQTYTSGTRVEYIYDYNDTDLVGTEIPVTLSTGTNYVTRTNHGLVEGQEIRLYGTTQVDSLVPCYVKYVDSNNFQVSLTQGGTAITFGSNDTASLLPYRVAIVTLTGSVNNIEFTPYPPSIGTIAKAFSSGWLEINIALPSLTSMKLTNLFGNEQTLDCLEIVRILNMSFNAFSTFSTMFYGLFNLRKVDILVDTSAITNISSMFQNCYNLEDVNWFNTSNVTNFANVFNGCYSLKEVPKFDYVKATDVSGLFNSCYSLEYVPDMNITNVCTSFQNMFNNCNFLKKVPNLGDTSGGINMYNMFSYSYLLEYVPDLLCNSATNISAMFSNCYSLKKAPRLLNINNPSITSLFQRCYSLKEIPPFNTANISSFIGVFDQCTSLEKVPELDMTSATNLNSLFNLCYSLKEYNLINTSNTINQVPSMHNTNYNLKEIPAINLSNTNISLNNIVGNCGSLNRIRAYGMANTFSVASTQLSNTALEEIFTNLATVTSKTITITNTPGAATCNRSIATSKGWSVSG